LRAAVKDPEMFPTEVKRDKVLTETHKNVLAARAAADKAEFSDAAQYQRRLTTELRAYVPYSVRLRLWCP
jgi:hypothetical protein